MNSETLIELNCQYRLKKEDEVEISISNDKWSLGAFVPNTLLENCIIEPEGLYRVLHNTGGNSIIEGLDMLDYLRDNVHPSLDKAKILMRCSIQKL